MSFKKLLFKDISEKDMARASSDFISFLRSRRSVREFSERDIPVEVIKNIVSAASLAPSGANKEPWYFTIVKDPAVKHEIRVGAENEEKAFYTQKATARWLKDLNKFVVFKQIYDLKDGIKYNNYYVNESVGIACGILLTAIHRAGLVALTHTPSPMGFLEKICKRPDNERAYLLIPVGYPADDAEVPDLKKKEFNEFADII